MGEVSPWEVGTPEAPAWCLASAVKPKAKAQADATDPWVWTAAEPDLLTHPGSPEGERRLTLVRLAGPYVGRDSDRTVYALAEAWAARCRPPFDEWRKHVDGLMRKDGALRMTTPSFVCLSENTLSPEAGRKQTNSPAPAEAPVPAPAELVCFLPTPETEQSREGLSSDPPAPSAETDASCSLRQEQGTEPDPSAGPAFPTLPPEAFHGLLGEMLRAVAPETEADPAGVLLGWLTCFGNVVGRGAWGDYGAGSHHPAIFLGVVCEAGGGKADSPGFRSTPSGR